MAGNNPKSQLDKFKQAARELECDDDDQRFKDMLAGLVKPTVVENPATQANKTRKKG